MCLDVAVQRVSRLSPAVPDARRIRRWAQAAWAVSGTAGRDLALTVRIVDESEAAALNQEYRGQGYVPNVLSFPMRGAQGVETGMLGDIVICPTVAEREAAEQGKLLEAHWAHLVVHGVLHCCGFEHRTDASAERMESLEKQILADFGYPDPYTVPDEQ